jgi:small nuclear ribonucleoprotein B and B'
LTAFYNQRLTIFFPEWFACLIQTRASKIMQLLNYRLKLTLEDGRTLVGQMIAFDRFMNFVLAECEEFRKIKQKGKVIAGMPEREEKRTLGLVVVRGENIISLSVEAPPPQHAEKVKLVQGPGIGKPAGRGMPISGPPAGPVRGAGGFTPGMLPPPGFRPVFDFNIGYDAATRNAPPSWFPTRILILF